MSSEGTDGFMAAQQNIERDPCGPDLGPIMKYWG